MKLIVQPDAGLAPIITAIKTAKKTIDIMIFRLDRPEITRALEAAVARGVTVRALIAQATAEGAEIAHQASAPADSDDVKLRVVPCDGPEAAYKVVGVVNNKLQSEADADGVCGQYPDADVVYWEGYAGRPGLVLCLQDLKKSK